MGSLDWTAEDEAEFFRLLDEEKKETPIGNSFFYGGRSCSHVMDPIALSDGTVLHASDFYSTKQRIEDPDIGFYLDRSWSVPYFNYAIAWEDFGIPECDAATIQRYARAAIRHAREGEIVDVACLGSHGRTGTFLAICELLCQDIPNADAAIAHIRKMHCSKAIETAEQEWYVGCIAALLTDSDLPMHPREIARKRMETLAKNASKKGGKKKNRKRS